MLRQSPGAAREEAISRDFTWIAETRLEPPFRGLRRRGTGASTCATESAWRPAAGGGSCSSITDVARIVERHAPTRGLRFGILQRTSVYWPTNHEAGEHTPGVAALRGHTAYQLPLHKTRPEIPPANRPGVPPEILTWADPAYLAQYREDIAALRREADIVVASHHWGLHEEVLQYMTEIAHAAIDSGADIVVGHGPHFSLPVEVYKGKPVFYGLGNFSFHTGHGGRKHGDWVGMMARVTLDERRIEKVAFQFVRHNEQNETLLRTIREEPEMIAKITERSASFGTRLVVDGDAAVVQLP